MSETDDESVAEASKTAKQHLEERNEKLKEVFSHVPKNQLVKTIELDSGKSYSPVIIDPNWNDFHFRYWDYGSNKDFWLVNVKTTNKEIEQAYSFWWRKKNSSEIKPSKNTFETFPDILTKDMLDITGYRKNWFVVENTYLEDVKGKVEKLFRGKKPKKEIKENMDEFAKRKAEEDRMVFVEPEHQEFVEEIKKHEEKVKIMENGEENDNKEMSKALIMSEGQSSQYLSLGRSVDEVLASWKEFRELDKALLDKSDYQEHKGKKFKKKSAFRKYKTAYVLSDEVVKEDTKFLPDGSYYSEFWVKAYPAGNPDYFTVGVGLVHSKEKCKFESWQKKNWKTNEWETQPPCDDSCNGLKHFDYKLHNIKSTAHTRAKNRAISDLVAGGEVSAEEVT